MSVTERLMKPGEWGITLAEETPYDVRSLLDFFGHVVITSTHVDSRRFSSAAMLSMSRYTGILRKRARGRRSIGGIGLEGWLGTPEGRGHTFEVAGLTTQTYAAWVDDILVGIGLTESVDPSVTDTLEANIIGMIPRQALDYIDSIYGTEYRVFADGTIRLGMPSFVGFVEDPTAIALRKGGGRDLDLTGLQALELDMESDVDDWINEVLVYANGEGGSVLSAGASTSSSYRNLTGNTFQMTLVVDSPVTRSGPDTLLALNELIAHAVTRKAIKLSTDTYDIGRDVAVGDWIYAYDPDAYLFDTANEVRYRGRILYPATLRVLAYTWPVESGMGVYYRDVDGVFTDLTQWVVTEDDTATTFEVGAEKRDHLDTGPDPAALLERLNR